MFHKPSRHLYTLRDGGVVSNIDLIRIIYVYFTHMIFSDNVNIYTFRGLKMSYRIILTFLLSLGLVNNVFSDEVTKLEEFSSKTGVVTLLEYSGGKAHSVLGGSFEVQIRKIGSVSKPGTVKGVQVKVNRGKYTGVAFIDLDEIEDLIEGIEYIMSVSAEVTDLENFESKFSTVGGLNITVFNGSDGSLNASLKAGSYQVFPEMTDLGMLVEDLKSASTALYN